MGCVSANGCLLVPIRPIVTQRRWRWGSSHLKSQGCGNPGLYDTTPLALSRGIIIYLSLRLQVLGQLLNPPRQHSDLNRRGAGVAVFEGVFVDDLGFGCFVHFSLCF